MSKIYKMTTEDKTMEVIEITEETKELLDDLKELEENLRIVRELNRKFIKESSSKLTEKLVTEISLKKSKILDSLGLV